MKVTLGFSPVQRVTVPVTPKWFKNQVCWKVAKRVWYNSPGGKKRKKKGVRNPKSSRDKETIFFLFFSLFIAFMRRWTLAEPSMAIISQYT